MCGSCGVSSRGPEKPVSFYVALAQMICKTCENTHVCVCCPDGASWLFHLQFDPVRMFDQQYGRVRDSFMPRLAMRCETFGVWNQVNRHSLIT